MNTRYLINKIGGLTLTFLFLAGITFFSTTTAQAQRRVIVRRSVIVSPYRVYNPYGLYRPLGWGNGWYDYGWYNPYSEYVFSNSEKASQKGYKNGFETGEKDGKKNKSYSPERSHFFHDAGFGNYGEVYRRAFSQGYRNGYQAGQNKRS